MGRARGVRVGVGVLGCVMVEVGHFVAVGTIVRVLVGVLEVVNDTVGDGVELGVGGIPETVKNPDDFHWSPTKISTS